MKNETWLTMSWVFTVAGYISLILFIILYFAYPFTTERKTINADGEESTHDELTETGKGALIAAGLTVLLTLVSAACTSAGGKESSLIILIGGLAAG